jgi:regulator of cell morphogenesis and NO signaling
MARIEALFVKVLAAHGENHPGLVQLRDAFEALRAELGPHMFKEEQVLFPYIASMEAALSVEGQPPRPPFGTVRNPVRMMTFEHDRAGDLLRRLRELSLDYTVPPDACLTYRTLFLALEELEQDLHQHVHLENNVLFPRALELESALLDLAGRAV